MIGHEGGIEAMKRGSLSICPRCGTRMNRKSRFIPLMAGEGRLELGIQVYITARNSIERGWNGR